MKPVGFLVACKHGHLDDFPWSRWVHGPDNNECNAGSGKLFLMSSASSGLQGGTITSSGTVSMKNSWMSNTSSALSSDTSTTSFTNSTGYPVFISGRANTSSDSNFTISFSGGSATLDMRDGDSGTYDVFATVLPNGATISGNSFRYVAVQMRPG